MKKRVYLTKEQRVEMIRLYGKGETLKELAKAFNVSYGTAKGVCANTANKKRARATVTDTTRKEVIDLRKAGKSYEDIAALTGVSRATVTRIVTAAGMKGRAKKKVAYSGGVVYLPQTARGLVEALAWKDEEPKDTIIRALAALSLKEQEDETFWRTNEGILEREEIDALLKPDSGAVIHTDDGPYLAHPLVSKKGDDLMEGFKLTLGITALLALLVLTLNQAGVL